MKTAESHYIKSNPIQPSKMSLAVKLNILPFVTAWVYIYNVEMFYISRHLMMFVFTCQAAY